MSRSIELRSLAWFAPSDSIILDRICTSLQDAPRTAEGLEDRR